MTRRHGARVVLVGGIFVGVAACASFDPDEASPAVDGGDPLSSSGAANGSSGGAPGSDASTPNPRDAESPGVDADGAAADVETPSECNELAQLGNDVPLELGGGNPDSATGGDTNGSWVLDAVKIYAPLLPVQKTVSATTLRMDNLAYQMLVGGSHSTGNAVISNATIVLTPTCGAGSELTGTTFSYVASGTRLKVFALLAVSGVPGSPFTVEYGFAKR